MAPRTVVLELAGEHKLARDLVAGGVFVPGERLKLNEDCSLVLRGANEQMIVTATCVWVDGNGSGLQLVGCDAGMKEQITALAKTVSETFDIPEPPPDVPTLDDAVPAPARVETDERIAEQDLRAALEQEVLPEEPPPSEISLADIDSQPPEAHPDADAVADENAGAEAAADEDLPDETRKAALNLHERLRGLTLIQQIKIAQHGEVSERIILERMYGKNVWEPLLRNPRLTGPEVARIARMGALPRTLIEIIVGNGGWLQIPEVRRALLSNPRLGTDQIMRVLRLLPKHELKLAAVQTAYPFAVRSAAKTMLRDV